METIKRGAVNLMNVLYVCVHNAGRSQMAEAITNHFALENGVNVFAKSAGTVGGKQLNHKQLKF